MKLSKLEPYLAVLLLVMVYVVSRQAGRMAAGVNVISGKERPVVVIDAGHGGNDPGKIGVDGSLEKDINLKIARKVKAYLEASDVQVVLTREDDQGLYTEKDSKKKMADMNRRCQIINETSPALTVSIHQNSYHQEEISGGQVFYYKGMCIPLFLKSLLLNLVCAEYKYCPCAKAVQGKVRRSKKRPFHCLLINPLL